MKQEQLELEVLNQQKKIKSFLSYLFFIQFMVLVIIVLRTIWIGFTPFGLKMFFTVGLLACITMLFYSIISNLIKNKENKNDPIKAAKRTFEDRIEEIRKSKLQGPTPEARDNFHPDDFKKSVK